MLYNYRSEYMANIAFDFIDNAAPNEKFLILAGGQHGLTQIVKNAWGSPNIWRPLGSYLKDKYQDNFLSLYYITLDEKIKLDDRYKNLLNSMRWESITTTPKFITQSGATKLRELLPFDYFSDFDGYIIDRSGVMGIMYSYALYDNDVLEVVIEQTKFYDAKLSLFFNEHGFDYSDSDVYFTITNLLINIYYLKLYFGENFPYDFWNPELSLNEGLLKLELILLEDDTILNKMAFYPPSIDILRDYHEYITFFKSIDENFWDTSVHGNIKKQISLAEPFMIKAKELFPYELWVEYWYAIMYVKDNNYINAYKYLQIILNNPLIYSLQIYPEILKLSARCADELGLYEKANEFREMEDALRNEYSIDMSYFNLFLQ